MTMFYPSWDEANRNRSHGQAVKMGPNGKGQQMYYAADVEPIPQNVTGREPSPAMGTTEERSWILMSYVETFTNVFANTVECMESEAIIRVWRTDCLGVPVDVWFLTIKSGTADIAIKRDGVTTWFGPMEALVYLHRELSDVTWQ